MKRLSVSAVQFILTLSVLGLTFVIASASDLNLSTSEPPQTPEFGVETVGYVSSTTNASFSYPKGWAVQDYVFNYVPYTRIENISARDTKEHSSQEGYLKIEILAFPDDGLALDAWVDNQNQRSQPGLNVLERREIEVAGEKAISQLEEYINYDHLSRAVFVAKGNKVYILNFSNIRQENSATINAFLSSFNFNR